MRKTTRRIFNSVTDPASRVARMRERIQNKDGKSKNWYRIRNVSEIEAEVYIYDEIGFWGVTAQTLVSELQALSDSVKTITLRINSPGGDVFDGMAIMSVLRDHKATVNVVIDGLAASAASFIAMAGDHITISDAAQIMIHDASGLAWGNADDMRAMAEILDRTSESIAGIYASRAGGTVTEWRDRMRANGEDGTWYTGQEAVDVGLADEVRSVVAKPAQPKDGWEFARRFVNRAKPEQEAPEPESAPAPIDIAAAIRAAVEPLPEVDTDTVREAMRMAHEDALPEDSALPVIVDPAELHNAVRAGILRGSEK